MTVEPVTGIGEIRPGDDLALVITKQFQLQPYDVVVVTQKIVSKAEGRLVSIDPASESERTRLVEEESVRVLRRRDRLMVTETSHGFVCANSGVDLSNVEDGFAALLPRDPDRSARRILDGLRKASGVDELAVIVSDTFGRPWRKGLVDVAIGCAGIGAVIDLRGTTDSFGRELETTEVCIADEVASAAELVMGKASQIPVAVVRGLEPALLRHGSVSSEVVRPYAEDLFR